MTKPGPGADRRGAITPEQAQEHPQRSVVLEALDGRDARSGDHHLPGAGGRSAAAVLRRPQRRGQRRADRGHSRPVPGRRGSRAAGRPALDQGGRDNISVAIADVVVSAQASEGWLGMLPALALRFTLGRFPASAGKFLSQSRRPAGSR